jgi:hypothetical protein
MSDPKELARCAAARRARHLARALLKEAERLERWPDHKVDWLQDADADRAAEAINQALRAFHATSRVALMDLLDAVETSLEGDEATAIASQLASRGHFLELWPEHEDILTHERFAELVNRWRRRAKRGERRKWEIVHELFNEMDLVHTKDEESTKRLCMTLRQAVERRRRTRRGKG